MAGSARIYPLPGGRDGSREPLWREVLGHRLRTLRLRQRETLAETAGRAGISPQYLSEIERGRKEPSSEMIAALAGALDVTLIELTEQVAGELRRQQGAAASHASARVPASRASVLSRAGGHAVPPRPSGHDVLPRPSGHDVLALAA